MAQKKVKIVEAFEFNGVQYKVGDILTIIGSSGRGYDLRDSQGNEIHETAMMSHKYRTIKDDSKDKVLSLVDCKLTPSFEMARELASKELRRVDGLLSNFDEETKKRRRHLEAQQLDAERAIGGLDSRFPYLELIKSIATVFSHALGSVIDQGRVAKDIWRVKNFNKIVGEYVDFLESREDDFGTRDLIDYEDSIEEWYFVPIIDFLRTKNLSSTTITFLGHLVELREQENGFFFGDEVHFKSFNPTEKEFTLQDVTSFLKDLINLNYSQYKHYK